MSAPVVIFAYRRAAHLQRVVAALRRNDLAAQTRITFVCDGPANPSARDAVAQVRKVVEDTQEGFAEVRRIYRPRNLGLAGNITSGVTELLRESEELVVLEDDTEPSPYFLRYVNDALNLYRYDEKVISVHGYCYPVSEVLPTTFFLRGADCWGWATWARGWALFEPDGTRLLQALRSRRLTRQFDFDGTFPYTRMLQRQIAGRNDSWAIRWHASAFLQDRLTLYPGRSLVYNTGNDGTGTHCDPCSAFDPGLADEPVPVQRLPLIENGAARAAFVDYFRAHHSGSWRRLAARIVNRLVTGRARLAKHRATPPE